jgi:microcystin-dependent protein
MADQYISQVELFAFGFAPKGWAPCAGQLLPINQNQALFALLGTTYGGDGRVTFGLPDLRGRLAAGFNSQTLPQGTVTGQETVTLLSTQVPSHSHAVVAINNGTSGGTATPSGSVSPGSPANSQTSAAVGGYSTTLTNTVPLAATGPSGNNTPHSNMMPYLTMNYCIALVGIFPSRS